MKTKTLSSIFCIALVALAILLIAKTYSIHKSIPYSDKTLQQESASVPLTGTDEVTLEESEIYKTNY